jgi:hypothetical protein
VGAVDDVEAEPPTEEPASLGPLVLAETPPPYVVVPEELPDPKLLVLL